jgi:CheY-like chemotaxis protein/anti-sigma regulatory factor (Ser/Thr protein kinase)
VTGDPQRLQQVVWNLLSNAVKFTPRGGRVRVAMNRSGAHVRIAVTDTGEGIDPAFLPHVFEQFRQADSSSTRRHGGLGLGLAIVRELVTQHGGTVHAESGGTGQGSMFTVELPLAASAAPAAGTEPPAVATTAPDTVTRTALQGLQVLVVDDDPDSNEVVSTLLSGCGAEVRTATSAPQALEVLGQWRPDVLVSDIAMPGTDGFALIAAVRERGGAFGQVPVIALTAYAGSEDRARALSAGFREHVAKPVNVTQLVRAVGDAVRPDAAPPA